MNTTTQTNGKAVATRAKNQTVHVRAATQTAVPDEVEIHHIEKRTSPVIIVGTSQLIVNNFGPKGAQQLEDERAQTKEEKLELKKAGRLAISPEEIERRFQAARCLDSKGRDCVRANWVKAMLVTAAKYEDIGIASTKLKGILFVEGDLLPITYKARPASESDEVITYYGTAKNPGVRPDGNRSPAQRRDVVRVGKYGQKKPDVRYRPAYDDWSLAFNITFEPRMISSATVYHLIRRAGMSVGLCEWRPQGPGGGAGGNFGRFDLKPGKAAL